MESYGRVGTKSIDSLCRLLMEAGTYGRERWAVARLLPSWRYELESAVGYALADIILLARGAYSGGRASSISLGRGGGHSNSA
eukprot:12421080-Karenia_brevis.AAC.1